MKCSDYPDDCIIRSTTAGGHQSAGQLLSVKNGWVSSPIFIKVNLYNTLSHIQVGPTGQGLTAQLTYHCAIEILPWLGNEYSMTTKANIYTWKMKYRNVKYEIPVFYVFFEWFINNYVNIDNGEFVYITYLKEHVCVMLCLQMVER